MEIYGLKNFDKCRRARRALNLSNIIDIKNEPIPEGLLQAAFLTFGNISLTAVLQLGVV